MVLVDHQQSCASSVTEVVVNDIGTCEISLFMTHLMVPAPLLLQNPGILRNQNNQHRIATLTDRLQLRSAGTPNCVRQPVNIQTSAILDKRPMMS